MKYTYKYDYINPNKETNEKGAFAPSCRGADQLIIYDENNPFMKKNRGTGVNPYGYEVAVNKNGIVIDANDRVKTPKNGYVLSSHGIAHRFLQSNVLLGSHVFIDKNNKLVHITCNKYKSRYIEFKYNKDNIIKRYKTALKNAYIIDKKKIDSLLNKINDINSYLKNFIRKNKTSTQEKRKFNYLLKKSRHIFDLLYLYTSNSSFIASRNIWTRPFEQNLQEIKNTLNICKKCNINGIYVESFYNGDIPGISKITETNEEVVNGYYGKEYKNDYLKAFISEAHKLNIEVHAWVECFFVGERSNQWKDRYKDEWHMVNYDGSTISGNNPEGNEKDFIWLDPANPECLQYVLSIYEELLTKYDFDGINVDYIRYPHGNYDIKYSSGYSTYAMEEFKRLNNLNGDVRKLIEDKDILDKWTQYRCDKITTLMFEIRKLVNRVKPSCLISMAVCSELDYAIKNKMQNWKIWAKKGWIDLTFPMAYYEGCSEVANATKELVEYNKDKAFSYTGIMCMLDYLPSMLVVKQINTLFENKADGYNIFQLSDLLSRKECQYNLIHSVNKVKSVHPHCDIFIVLKAFIKELKERKPFFNEKFDDIDLLINDIKSIIIKCKNEVKVSKELIIIKNKLHSNLLKKELLKLIRYSNVSNTIKTRKNKQFNLKA